MKPSPQVWYVKQRILFVLLLPCLLLCTEPDTKTTSGRTYNVLLGINYSNYRPTAGYGKLGNYLGVYGVRKLSRSLGFKYGYTYTVKKVDRLDQKFKIIGFGGTRYWHGDIVGNFHFIEANIFLSYQMVHRGWFVLKALVGTGIITTVRRSDTFRDLNNVIIDDPVERDAYYRLDPGFEDYQVGASSGTVLHGGLELMMGNYLIDLLYSYPHHDNSIKENNLYHGQHLYSVTLVLGICI